jgi:hypothetical protein
MLTGMAPGSNEGGFIRSAAGPLSALRGMVDAETFERVQRSRDRHRQPRPLAGSEREVVRETAAPLLRDLAASGLPQLDIRYEAHEDRGDEAVCAWMVGPGRTGTGIWIWLDSTPADQVTELAEQFQNWAADQLVEAGRSPEWPACPAHRVSHGLNAQARDGVAVWVCPEGGQVICEIGALGKPGGSAHRLYRVARGFGGVLPSGRRGPNGRRRFRVVQFVSGNLASFDDRHSGCRCAYRFSGPGPSGVLGLRRLMA